ncbi:hypothetical protein RJ640_029197 [Escallonia rubra]|uniref:Uncharacterized protein n=1 Tax=Escallonia rubra TaxID=112253 RepID=A0AA88UPY8_9ASTE|nr:hypothetical protein RJ640_029197 [Escallonia rubra]
MANLRTAMDSAFWDLNLATPQTLDGVARAIPGEPVPLDGARGSRALRIQQLSLMGNGFPLVILLYNFCEDVGKEKRPDLILCSDAMWSQQLKLEPQLELESDTILNNNGSTIPIPWEVLPAVRRTASEIQSWLRAGGKDEDLRRLVKGDRYQDRPLGWLGLIGQFRPKKLISAIKAELSGADEWELSIIKDVAKHFVDKSLFSVGLCSQLSLSSSSSILLSMERHGKRKERRTKVMLFHKAKYDMLPDHDITLEAAWPELFVDHSGNYWNVPESISLDCSSLVSESGLRYRFGIHENRGQPEAENPVTGDAPLALMPGLCAKASFSYEKSKDLWRQKETKEDLIIETNKGRFWWPAYDIRLKEPHAAISGIIGSLAALYPSRGYGEREEAGFCFRYAYSSMACSILRRNVMVVVGAEGGGGSAGTPAGYVMKYLSLLYTRDLLITSLTQAGGTCGAWFGGKSSVVAGLQEDGGSISESSKNKNPVTADIFGSVCYTFQHGKFRKRFGDLTRVDARLDISSAWALAKRASKIIKKSSADSAENLLSSPRLNLIFQQQVVGPIVFRVDSRFLLDSSGVRRRPHMEDVIYSLSYSLRLLESGKVVAWYSPKRKEGMIELRLFEF